MTTRTAPSTRELTLAAMLTALAIFIPMVMPILLIIGPASYTLASHLPIFLAMFIKPRVGIIAAIGATIGFLIAGLPIVIVLRAASHLIFAAIGAYYLQAHPTTLNIPKKRYFFSFWLNIIHALAEVVVVALMTNQAGVEVNYFYMLGILIGVGTLIHGMVDLELAYFFAHTISQRTRHQLLP